MSPEMCLKLRYQEARLWNQRAHQMVAGAVAAGIPTDPLLMAAPRLSEVVSVVDSVKKRHGPLIEDALIAAINGVQGWVAEKSKVPRPGKGYYKPDCIAVNQSTKTAYVFECKRNYGSLDAPAKREADERLDEIGVLFPAYAASRGWPAMTPSLFILSFYGTAPGSKHPVYDRNSASALFPSCVVRFARDFISYTEEVVGTWAAERAYNGDGSKHPELLPVRTAETEVRKRGNIFYQLDQMECDADATVEIGENGLTVI